jgi:hypothetical protein
MLYVFTRVLETCVINATDGARVDAAGEERAERHVGHEPHAHRLAQALAQPFHRVRLGDRAVHAVGSSQ